MERFRTVGATQAFVASHRRQGHSVGFVPTMGALHRGHLSLMRRAREECDVVLASVFVNPTQFGPGEDFERYPRDIERDAQLAEEAGVDALFAPSAREMYPEGFGTYVLQEGQFAECLEGQFRPGHFRGVLTVCCKLFHIVQADRAYFGQKDYQQAVVIRRMARDLDIPLEIVVCPIVREPDGLALSSRNQYLSAAERGQATCLYRGLQLASARFAQGERDAARLAQAVRQTICDAGPCRIDYVAVADAETLEPLATVDRPAAVLVAVHLGATRLIDNCLLVPPAAVS